MSTGSANLPSAERSLELRGGPSEFLGKGTVYMGQSETALPFCVESEMDLAGGHRLLVRRGLEKDLVHILGVEGGITLTIQLTESGPVLQLDGAKVVITATDQISLQADRLELVGRSGVSVTSGGDVNLQTRGDINSAARIQSITATRGNVNIRANDDIKMNGERYLMDC